MYFANVKISEQFDMKDLNVNEYNKLMDFIYVHGYRGASKKKHNGVVPIRPTDKQLWKDLNKSMNNEPQEI